jgi:hypothetical protein
MRRYLTVLIPLLLFGQLLSGQKPKPAAPPADVDKSLRDRASAFLQYQVDGNFRKAFELVAEDSKDFYFSIAKSKIQSFKIDEVTYSDSFSKATVRATILRRTLVAGHELEIPGLSADIWKLEDGKWVWYHDPNQDITVPFFPGLTIGGGAAVPPGTVDPKFLPKDTSPEAVAAAAANLIQPTSFSKAEAKFVAGKAATEEVVFHNGNRGQIKVYARVRGNPPGITVEPAESFVNALAYLTFKVSYAPGQKTPEENMVLFEVQPFGTTYTFPVTVAPVSGPSAQK